jgi:hypothetical protein
MKRIGYLMMAAALAAGGCLPDSFLRPEKKPPRVEMKPPPAPVTADGINEQNARERARALREELDRDLARQPPAGPRKE